MAAGKVTGDFDVTGNITRGGTHRPDIPRTNLQQEALVVYPIPWELWRVFDAFATLLPGTPATDDLGLVGGTFATDTPSLQTEDLKAAGATNKRARCVLQVPAEYDPGATMKLRFSAGMLTAVADTTATLDVEVFLFDREGVVSGSDLITTAATTINSLTLADKDFTIDAGALSPGDQLDVRITIAVNDAAGGTAVKGIIGSAELLCDIRG